MAQVPEQDASDDPLDRAIGEYLVRIDRRGLEYAAEVRAEILDEFPEITAGLSEYFADEDGVAGTMKRFVTDSRSQSPRRVLRDIGEYELLELLGRGGMGEVYRARQANTGRIVAVKIMRMAAPIERFRREIEIVAKLRHPHIVTLFEADEENGEQFYSMEFVAGGSLAERADLSPQEVATIGLKLAHALEYAHQRNILHRDIKPDNILIDELGEPLIADFGLAKLTESTDTLTTTHNVVGTFAYMAPEQARGENSSLTPACDVYSLGATLYRMLCGHPPIQGANAAQLISNIQTQEIPAPRAVNSAIPRDLEQILLKCLERDPRNRYGSARELGEHLQLFLDRKPVPIFTISKSTRFRRWVEREPIIASMMFAVIAVLLIALLVVQSYRRQSEATADRLSKSEANARRLEGFAEGRAKVAERRSYARDLRLAKEFFSRGNETDGKTRLAATDEKLRGWEYGRVLASVQSFERTLELPKGEDCASVAVTRRQYLHPILGNVVTIACGTKSGDVYLWLNRDNEYTKPLRLERRVASPIRCLAISSLGMFLVTGNDNGDVSVWDLREPNHFAIVGSVKCSARVTAVAISEDQFDDKVRSARSPLVAASTSDGTTTLWERDTLQQYWTSAGREFQISTLCLSPGNRLYENQTENYPADILFAEGDFGGNLRIWGTDSVQPLATVELAHPGGVFDLSFSEGRLVSCGANGGTNLWILPVGSTNPGIVQSMNSIPLHPAAIPAIYEGAVSPRGESAIWVGVDVDRILRGRRDPIHVVHYQPIAGESRRLQSVSDAVSKSFNAPDHNVELAIGDMGLMMVVGHGSTVYSYKLLSAVFSGVSSPNTLQLLPGLTSLYESIHELEIVGVGSERLVVPVRGVLAATIDSDSAFIATLADDGEICVWDVREASQSNQPDKRHLLRLSETASLALRSGVAGFRFSQDGRLLVVASTSGELSVIEVATGSTTKYESSLGPVSAVSFAPRGDRLILTHDRDISLVDVIASRIRPLISTPQQIVALASHPTLDLFAVALNNGGIYVFSLNGFSTIQMTHQFDADPSNTSMTLCFHPREHRLFSIRARLPDAAQLDERQGRGSLKVWDLETAEIAWEEDLSPFFRQPYWIGMKFEKSYELLIGIATIPARDGTARQTQLQQWRSSKPRSEQTNLPGAERDL